MLLRIVLAGLACVWTSQAALKKIYLIERTDVPGYPYERIVAKAHFAVDPQLAANRIIRDLDLAPKNADGQVEFSADLFVLKPRNPADGNGTLLFEVCNRGRKLMLGTFNFAPSNLNPRSKEDFGDGYLLKQGYTLVWLGWQADVPVSEADLLRLHAPVARHRDGPVTGLVRAQWIPDAKIRSQSLADRTMLAYPAMNPDDRRLKLTVQDSPSSPRREIPRPQWQFAREEGGKVVPDATHVYLASGFEPGKIYELVYTAQDPVIVGLGPAGIRDLVSFLRYERDGAVLLGDQSRFLKHAIAFGTSQSGRFLRTFLYFGFNRDEKDRKVFDGVWAHVAGAGRGSFNHRFAQPSRDGHPFFNLWYPTDIFPFTDLAQTDSETGLTDGILSRAEQDKTVPKIFYTNGSYEYWGRAASLIHTSLDGTRDFPLAPETRIYLLAGTQHGAGAFPPRKGSTQHLSNPNDYRFAMRGLLKALTEWVKEGKQPPPSAFPSLARGELTAPRNLAFPKIAGVRLPENIQTAWRADFGEEFRSRGIVTQEPPVLGKPFPTLVPQVDRDGNETSGIRLPEIQVPLGTYTGWNLRDPAIGAPDQLYSMVGAFFPFPRTRKEREQSRDPRLSIEERYASKQEFLAKIRQAASALAQSRYILAEDVSLLEQRASMMWDQLASPGAGSQ